MKIKPNITEISKTRLQNGKGTNNKYFYYITNCVYILQNFVLWQFDLLLPQFKRGGNDIKNCLECFREPKKGK